MAGYFIGCRKLLREIPNPRPVTLRFRRVRRQQPLRGASIPDDGLEELVCGLVVMRKQRGLFVEIPGVDSDDL